jgi:hypothetical protein
MQRKGMMVGSGKSGYYNITGRDPMVHAMSAKGIKQPQRAFMPINPAIRRYSNEKLQEGMVKEHIEHPKFTMEQARQIAKDHLTENPRAYGKLVSAQNMYQFRRDDGSLFWYATPNIKEWGNDFDTNEWIKIMEKKHHLRFTGKVKYYIQTDKGGKCGGKNIKENNEKEFRIVYMTNTDTGMQEYVAYITLGKKATKQDAFEAFKRFNNLEGENELISINKVKGGKGGKHLFTKIQSPKSKEEIVNELSKSLKDKGYTFNIGINKGHIELGDVRLGDKKVAKEGYNVSPYTGRHGRILNWQNWVEVNNTINDVLDKTGTSANVSSLKGKFKIRRGNVGVNEGEWESQGSENVGSMMRPVSRFEAWESEGKPGKIRRR